MAQQIVLRNAKFFHDSGAALIPVNETSLGQSGRVDRGRTLLLDARAALRLEPRDALRIGAFERRDRARIGHNGRGLGPTQPRRGPLDQMNAFIVDAQSRTLWLEAISAANPP